MRHPPQITSGNLQAKNTVQTEYGIKREPAPPPIMVDGVKSYEGLYGELINHISKESFQFKFTNDTTAKLNCNNSENYRKAIHVLQTCNFNFNTYENKQTRPLWQRTCTTRANRKT
jgi:hypothetical protein